jgi:hypothetical protein
LAEYLISAEAARRLSQTSWNEFPDPDIGSTLPSDIANSTRDFARLLTDVIWTPSGIRRMVCSWRLMRLVKARSRISKDNYQEVLRMVRHYEVL